MHWAVRQMAAHIHDGAEILSDQAVEDMRQRYSKHVHFTIRFLSAGRYGSLTRTR
jgi:hypothetical protein